ncbi:hypothetical protein L484_014086 [Morus notabilis]|uniref:Uncharacterized protein n=1 Tax=Morus notabilis TaxID=981085 RepID=W9RMF7_9ROSA|nr:hypothetical protein L484_014086 [Morus notabilis]
MKSAERIFYLAIPLSKQLDYYREYQEEIVELVGVDNVSLISSRGIHILSLGNSDLVQNYYINPVLNIAQTPKVQKFARFIKSSDIDIAPSAWKGIISLNERIKTIVGPPPNSLSFWDRLVN